MLISQPARVDVSALGFEPYYVPPIPDIQSIPVLSNVVGIGFFTALTREGHVVNWFGHDWVPVPFGLTNIVSIADSLAAVDRNGVLATIPDRPINLTNIVSVAPSGLALTADGSIAIWEDTPLTRAMPTDLRDVVEIQADSYTAIVILGNGTAICWQTGLFTVPPTSLNLSNLIGAAVSNSGFDLSGAVWTENQIFLWKGGMPGPISVYPDFYKVTDLLDVAIGPNRRTLHLGGSVDGAPPEFHGVTDLWASDSYAWFVIGEGIPFFQPVRTNRQGRAGIPMFLKGRAVGAMPISYQWRSNGQNLPGETNYFLKILQSEPLTATYELIANNFEGNSTLAFHVQLDPAPLTLYVKQNGADLTIQFTPNPSGTAFELFGGNNLHDWSVVSADTTETNGTYQFHLSTLDAPFRFFKTRQQVSSP